MFLLLLSTLNDVLTHCFPLFHVLIPKSLILTYSQLISNSTGLRGGAEMLPLPVSVSAVIYLFLDTDSLISVFNPVKY